MIRYIELVLLATLTPTLATSSLSVRRFIAPQQLYTVDSDAEQETNDGTSSSDGGSPAEPSPLEFLAFRPGSLQHLTWSVQFPMYGKPAVLPLHERMSATLPIWPGGPRLERVVAQSRCVATSLMVVAPPVEAHAPPAVGGW